MVSHWDKNHYMFLVRKQAKEISDLKRELKQEKIKSTEAIDVLREYMLKNTKEKS